jgi:protein-disulfide isomerase
MNTARPHLALPVGARDHIWGPASAPVTLVEYADYECPFCKAAHPIVQHIGALKDEDLVARAAAVGLDVARFARELAAGIYAPRVREDFMSGVRSGVNGTPAFYVNGARHDGGFDAKSLLEAIEYASETRDRALAERGEP